MPMLAGFLGLIGIDSENGNALWFNLVTEPGGSDSLSVNGTLAWFRLDKSTAGLAEGTLWPSTVYQLKSNRIKVQVYHGPALAAENRLTNDSFAVIRLCRLTGTVASGSMVCTDTPYDSVERNDAIS